MACSILPAIIILMVIYLQVSCSTGNRSDIIQYTSPNHLLSQPLSKRLTNIWTWIKSQTRSEDTFIGRCAHGIRKLGMALNFIVFKLGIIITALIFIGALVFKGLALGVLILVISSVGLFAKLAPYKYGVSGGAGGYELHHSPAIHLHVHNKGDHVLDHHGHAYSEKTDAASDQYLRTALRNNLYGSSELYKDTYR